MDPQDPQTPTPPKRRGRRLANVGHVKSGLADVIRQLESGAIEPKKANALVYAYVALAGVIQGADLEKRIAAIEAREAERSSTERRLAS